MADDREYEFARPEFTASSEVPPVVGIDGKPLDSPLNRGGRKLTRVRAVLTKVNADWCNITMYASLDKNQTELYSLGNALDGLDVDGVWVSINTHWDAHGEVPTMQPVVEATVMRALTGEGAGAHLSGWERRVVDSKVTRFDCWAVITAPTAVLALFEGSSVRFAGV